MKLGGGSADSLIRTRRTQEKGYEVDHKNPKNKSGETRKSGSEVEELVFSPACAS